MSCIVSYVEYIWLVLECSNGLVCIDVFIQIHCDVLDCVIEYLLPSFVAGVLVQRGAFA